MSEQTSHQQQVFELATLVIDSFWSKKMNMHRLSRYIIRTTPQSYRKLNF